MVKTVVAVSLMFLLVPCSYAGQSGDYVGVSSGVLLTRSSDISDRNGSSANLKYSTIGLPVGVSLGHQFENGVRVEEELLYKRATLDGFRYAGVTSHIDSSVWCVAAMSNLYYDWYHNVDVMADSWFQPYAVAGVGIAEVGMSEGNVKGLKLWGSDADTAFAYQLGIGIGVSLRKDIILDISYRYFDAQHINIDQVTSNFQNSTALLGVRYLFR